MDRIIAAQVFVTIVEGGSLAEAARRLDMSRSMVTRYLNAMEDWAGTRLLHRSTRSQSLTAAGEEVLIHAREMEKLAHSIPAPEAGGDAPLKGRVRVSCAQSLATDVLAPVGHECQTRHPAVSVDLHSSNLPVNLVSEGIDIAVRITNDLDPNLIARKLGECRSVLCASPAYLARAGTPQTPADLEGHACLHYAHFGKGLWQFSRDDEQVSVAISGPASSNDHLVLLNLAQAGAGLTLQPRYAVHRLIARGHLTPLLRDYDPMPLGLHLLFKTRTQMGAAQRAMIDHLAASLRPFSKWEGAI